MARFTLSLREMCETFGREYVESIFKRYELSDYLTPSEIATIEKRGTWNKDKLSRKIVDHFYMHEIGQETPALFEHYAKVAMQEIMEEKLPIIYSLSIEYDPLVNVDFTESYKGSSKSEAKSKSDGISLNSDTPQGRVKKSDILAGNYASQTSGSEANSEGTSDDSNEYTKTTKGNSGVSATAQALLRQYRENIIMVDRDIIEDLAQLFHGMMML